VVERWHTPGRDLVLVIDQAQAVASQVLSELLYVLSYVYAIQTLELIPLKTSSIFAFPRYTRCTACCDVYGRLGAS
jgi:hypothetical protein